MNETNVTSMEDWNKLSEDEQYERIMYLEKLLENRLNEEAHEVVL